MGAIALCGIGTRLGSWAPGWHGAELSRDKVTSDSHVVWSVYRTWRVKRDSQHFLRLPESLALWCTHTDNGGGEQSFAASSEQQQAKESCVLR